jgi:hypothetical protein
MELKTRQTLRPHKKDLHGVMPLMTPPGQRGPKPSNSMTPTSLGSAGQGSACSNGSTAFDFTNTEMIEMKAAEYGMIKRENAEEE